MTPTKRGTTIITTPTSIPDFVVRSIQSNGLSQIIPQNLRILRIFTENSNLHRQKADFNDLYTIGSEFAVGTRSHTPFPAVFAKNAVSENFYCQNLRKNSRIFCAIFRETQLAVALSTN